MLTLKQNDKLAGLLEDFDTRLLFTTKMAPIS